MGTWGTGIFADDLAADVRGDWRDALVEGLSSSDASARLLERFKEAASDRDESPRFWMSLAAAESETGRLEEWVRDRALAIIDSGADVEQFDPQDQARRRKAITSLAEKLRGPQRAPVKLSRPRPQASPVAVGDVIRIRGTKRLALFVVVGMREGWPPGSEWPVLAGLRWEGVEVPQPEDLLQLPLVRDRSESSLVPNPVVTYSAVSGPTRGPRSYPNFGEVVAHGIIRTDAPAIPEAGSQDAQLQYAGWQNLPGWVEGEWYDRMLALTDQFEALRPSGWKALARRLAGGKRSPRSP
jgi:hypothetical protein